MKRRIILALLVLFALPAYGQEAKHRVVLQVSDSDPAKWNLALNNARNIQQDLGRQNVEVEIVAYGPGLGMSARPTSTAACASSRPASRTS